MIIPDILMYILVIIFGLSVGSFLNVVVLRFDSVESIIKGRSHCPKCKKILKWYELVPFFSYILLVGKCKGCKKTISLQYPLIELFTALIFVLIYYFYGLSIESLLLGVISSILIVLATYDILHMEIPDILSYLVILFALIFVIFLLWKNNQLGDTSALLKYVYGFLVGIGFLGLLVLISREKLMGAGDVLIGAFMGILLGFPNIILALFSAFFIGSFYGIGLILIKKKKLKDPVPFGPFLVLGTFIALFWGEYLINTYWTFHW